MNLYLGIVADSGSSKSPLYREFVREPFGNILAAEKEAYRTALSYWRNQPQRSAETSPPGCFRSSTTGTTAPPWT